MSHPPQPGPDQFGGNPYPQQPPPYGQPPYGQPQYGPWVPLAGDPGTLDLPWYGIGFADAVKRAFLKYARFDGRASRSEYWWFGLAQAVALFVLYGVLIAGAVAESDVLAGAGGLLLLVFLLAIVVPSISVAVRRLHDGGFSGWLYLLGFVPLAGIVLVVFLCLPSKPEGAMYDRFSGPVPGGHAG